MKKGVTQPSVLKAATKHFRRTCHKDKFTRIAVRIHNGARRGSANRFNQANTIGFSFNSPILKFTKSNRPITPIDFPFCIFVPCVKRRENILQYSALQLLPSCYLWLKPPHNVLCARPSLKTLLMRPAMGWQWGSIRA